jgi:hypothetical protein
MALASSSSSFGSLTKKNGTTSNNKNGTSTALDFYESMYHLQKMFPKLDSEVIESVLRSNQGQVDKTLDQLLTITMDDELNEIGQDDTLGAAALVANNIPAVAEKPADAQLTLISDDLPPSYHEFMTSISTTTTTTTSVTVTQQPKPENSQIVREEDNFDPFGLQTVSKQQKQQSSTLYDFQVQASAIKTRKESSNGEATGATSLVNGKSGVLFPVVSVSENRYNWRSRAMTGELRKDFLRVKLTNEQLKKFKSSIKKAKRDEITAIVNNVRSHI